MELNTVEELISDIRMGKMVILMDDEDRENEGDLIIAAEQVRAEDINFMATHARGLICLTLSPDRCEKLKLPLMVQDNNAQFATNFTVSIEAAEGVTTGISAADRAHTVRTAVARNVKDGDIVQPGHIFPLMAQPGGVLSRAGHTEAGCDLARLSGFEAASVIVEIMNDDGTMARRPDLEKFAEEHGLKIGTIADLIHYRTLNERTVNKISEQTMQTDYGTFQLHTFKDNVKEDTHLALVMGDIKQDEPTMVRVHVPDTLRDLLAAKRGDAPSWSMKRSMEAVAAEGRGVVVMLASPEEENIEERLNQYFGNSQDIKAEVKVDGTAVYRTIGTGSQILRDLGVGKMRLLSSPMKFNAISGFDLEVVEYISCED